MKGRTAVAVILALFAWAGSAAHASSGENAWSPRPATPVTDCAAVLGTDPCYPTAPQALSLPGTYSIERSPAKPSALNLPLLPYACLEADGGHDAQPADLGDRATDTGRTCRLRPSG